MAYDFVQILLDELTARGLSYIAASILDGTDVELPIATGDDLRLVERQAILVRDDLRRSELKLLAADSGHFSMNLSVPLGDPEAGLELTILRGWTSVDVKVRGKVMRVVNAHLEAFHPLIRLAQAGELLAGPAGSDLPTILLGDFNDDPDLIPALTYDLLTASGFTDAWLATDPALPGFTWGRDEDLLNPESRLSQRLDLILYAGDLSAVEMKLIGHDPADRTPSGLWPSDHAGLVATLQIHSRPAFARAPSVPPQSIFAAGPGIRFNQSMSGPIAAMGGDPDALEEAILAVAPSVRSAAFARN